MADGATQGKPAPLIGILAVKFKFISEAQLQKALDQCSDDTDLDEKLKAYFLAEKLISSQNLHRLTMAVKAVAIHRREYRFGAIALAKGVVNKMVLDLALEEQKELFQKGKKPRPIGDVMVESGIMSPKQRDEILKLQKQSCSLLDRVGTLPVKIVNPADSQPVDHDGHHTSADDLSELSDSNDVPVLDRLEDIAQICGGLLLQVTCDHMSAFLTKICDMDPDIPAVVIRTALSEKGVVYGLVPDEQLEVFIRSSITDTVLFCVARGVEPSPGKDTGIEFFINTGYLKSSGMDDSGNIDVKRISPKQRVEKGSVLAEKIAGLPQAGKDVFGNIISAPGTTKNSLRAGAGAVLSEDGQKVLAAVQGTPQITLDGSITVHERSNINTDIDNDTGTAECDKSLRVTGSIKSGARVYGVDIWAQGIDDGIVEASGDLTIAHDINNARIYARGNVHAQSISNSEIVCMGDVLVKKKIVDSKIECGGTCSIITGKLVSSRVAAKMGLMAGSISSESSCPSRIRIGHDAFSVRELERNRLGLMRIDKIINKFNNKKNMISKQAAGLKTQMTELERVRERILVEYREIESRSDRSPSDRESLDQRLTGLRKNLKAVETKLQAGAAKIQDLVKQTSKIDRQILKPAASKQILADEKKNLIDWSLHTPGRARVVVAENVVSGTIIMGLHSTLVPETALCHVRITERPIQSEDENTPQIFYQMQVDDL
nr:FapA family protein [uncultured Desulfobacter sp.]